MSIQIHLLSSNWCAEHQNLKDIYNITKNIFVIMNNDVYIYSCGMTIYEESVENFQVEFGDGLQVRFQISQYDSQTNYENIDRKRNKIIKAGQ